MFEHLSSTERTVAIQRLTALWALNECGLGGILHAVKSPFTGLVLGSIAMLCIALICTIAENKWKPLLTALLTVLIIKAMVSPHSSPTAYFAVTFQALSGVLIYRYIPNLLFASILFVTLGHIESAFQRLLTLTILYGNSLWEAVNMWGKWVSEKWMFVLPLSSSQLIILTYLTIHFIAGILVGWVIYRIIKRTHQMWGDVRYRLELSHLDKKSFGNPGKKKPWYQKFIFILVLLLLIVLSYTFRVGERWETAMITMVRVVIILLLWFAFIAPLLIRFLRKYLNRKQHQLSEQVSETMDLLPQIAWILDKSWKESKQLPITSRWKAFILNSLLYTIQFKSTHDPHTDRPHAES